MPERGTWERDLRAATERNQFLKEWLSASEADRAAFETGTQNLSNEERQAVAIEHGFRTWHGFVDCLQHKHRTLKQFVSEPAFKTLWNRLRDYDAKQDWHPELYGPHRGGVPHRLIDDIETWHQLPKFTAAELAKHNRKIIEACDELIVLIEQVSPGPVIDWFATLHMSHDQAESVFRNFKSPLSKDKLYRTPFTAGLLLARAGVTPLTALRTIKESASAKARAQLPTKVHAQGAFRTYIIHRLCDSLARFGLLRKLPVFDQLIADVVGLVANTDCAADDVRKAMKERRDADRAWSPEDSASLTQGIIHRES